MQHHPRTRSSHRGLAKALLGASLLLLFAAGSASAEATPDDGDVRTAVERQMLHDAVVSLNDVDVAVSDGIVSLEGLVDSLLEKERAVRIARAVRGVRGVVDRLAIDPEALRPDAVVKRDVEAGLATDPATESYQIEVSVAHGVVTLRGAVDSWREHALAQKVARSIDGVLEVEDAMVVNTVNPRSDAEIEAEIERTLDWDVRIDDTWLDVEVVDGVVQLRGTVGSAAERDHVVESARVLGVDSIDPSRLEVREWADDAEVRDAPRLQRDDDAIADAVRHALAVDPRVFSFDVGVEVEGGFVTLSGVVDNLKARRAAVADAHHVTGVRSVWNRIKVRAPRVPDEQLAMRVRGNLVRDPFVDSAGIDVRAESNEIVLEGEVSTWWARMRAEDLASRATGVQQVENRLRVRERNMPLVYDPYVDQMDWVTIEWYRPEPIPVPVGDDKLERLVENELFWSPFADLGDVEVTVENGVVRLSGAVDSRAERHAAIMNAYEAGAGWVVDELELKTPAAESPSREEPDGGA